MIKKIAFIGHRVQDMDRARRFYGELLGLQQTAAYESKWCEFDTPEGKSIALDTFSPEGTAPYMALETDDIEAEVARLKEAGVEKKDIDAVAATYAPGLIGAVLVGLNFAKSAAYALNVPLIPVHHIRGHIAANYLAFPELEPPFLALCMSGGNTLIVDVRGYTDFALLGATRDDAAGECFDKAARVLGISRTALYDKLKRMKDPD